ncbi:MAG: ribosome maturation factor RimP [Clostridia bacterium]
MDKKNTTEKTVWQFIEPLLTETPYEIYDVEYVKEGSEWYLRIFIDKEGCIDLDDCETVTDLINDPLDELDPIAEAYFLEVSSPGVERHLKSMRHFEGAVGEKIRVKTFVKMENSKEWVGILKSVDENGITLDANGKTIVFPFEKIAKANISVF